MLEAVDSAKDLTVYTLRICSNEKIFLPQFEFMTNDIRKHVLKIYEKAYEATTIRVQNQQDWIKRRKLQKEAISKYMLLLSKIDIAKRLYHLKSKKVNYWIKSTVHTKKMLIKWYEGQKIFCKDKF